VRNIGSQSVSVVVRPSAHGSFSARMACVCVCGFVCELHCTGSALGYLQKGIMRSGKFLLLVT
jgi:hypothetical protein